MRWVIVLVVLFVGVVAFGGFWLSKQAAIADTAEECVGVSDSRYNFVLALSENDAKLCNRVQGVWEARCQAMVVGDVALCDEFDRDCRAIVSGNSSLCVEPVCQALALGDSAVCAQAPEDTQAWCRAMVELDVEFFAPNATACREFAKGVN